jgi:hypothetical protein
VCVAYLKAFEPIELRSTFYSFLSTNCVTCVCESDIYMVAFIKTIDYYNTFLKRLFYAIEANIQHINNTLFVFKLVNNHDFLKR